MSGRPLRAPFLNTGWLSVALEAAKCAAGCEPQACLKQAGSDSRACTNLLKFFGPRACVECHMVAQLLSRLVPRCAERAG